MKLIWVLLFLLFSFEALALKKGETSIQWQKAELEQQIRERVEKGILPIVGGEKVVVEVSIVVDENYKKRRRVRLRKPKGSKETQGLFPLSKLGLWIDTESLQNAANEAGKDIFEQISSVNVYILYDQRASVEAGAVEAIVQQSLDRFGKFKSSIDVQKVDFAGPSRGFGEWVDDFKLPIGVLFATILLIVLMVWIASRYQSLEKQKIAIMENEARLKEEGVGGGQATASGADFESDSGEKEASAAPKSIGTVSAEGNFKGVDQFKALIRQDLSRSVVLIKQWLGIKSERAIEALYLLPHLTPMDELAPLFDQLDEDERKSWKGILSQDMTDGFDLRGDAFILSQIVGYLLEPPIPVEKEIRDLLAGITPEESVKCAEKDPFLGAIFANTMSTAQVARMFGLMSADAADEVVKASLDFSYEKVTGRVDEIKTLLEGLRQESNVQVNPLLEKSLDLIREVGPEKEGTFFRALAQAGEEGLLRQAAQQFFPADAISDLPRPVLRDCLKKLSLSFRGELLVSLEGSARPQFLEAVGKEGSKMRDLMENEIEQIESDEKRVKQIEKNKLEIWNSFVQVCRKALREEEELAEASLPALEAWVHEQIGGKDAA